jgi:hypothetical protein
MFVEGKEYGLKTLADPGRSHPLALLQHPQGIWNNLRLLKHKGQKLPVRVNGSWNELWNVQ